MPCHRTYECHSTRSIGRPLPSRCGHTVSVISLYWILISRISYVKIITIILLNRNLDSIGNSTADIVAVYSISDKSVHIHRSFTHIPSGLVFTPLSSQTSSIGQQVQRKSIVSEERVARPLVRWRAIRTTEYIGGQLWPTTYQLVNYTQVDNVIQTS